MANLYTILLDRQLGHLYGMLDKAPASRTHGSLDRALASEDRERFSGRDVEQHALVLA